MKPRVGALALALVLALSASPVIGQTGDARGADQWLAEGESLIDADRFEAALDSFEKALEADPRHLAALSMAANVSRVLKQYAKAAAFMERLRPIVPGNLRLRQDLIRMYMRLGEYEKREVVRQELMALWKASDDPDKEPSFLMDDFEVDAFRVLAHQVHELMGERAVRYHFAVFRDGLKTPVMVVSLGSYASTDNFDRESNPDRAYDRLFHLDGYATVMHEGRESNQHQTLGFFQGEPPYAKVRALVIDYLKGASAPASSSRMPKRKAPPHQ